MIQQVGPPVDPSVEGPGRIQPSLAIERWPDAWLIEAIHRGQDEARFLEILAGRHWKPLYARCYLLTLDPHRAADLAQDTWCRVLRRASTFRPESNFNGYLKTVATNLWRDSRRSSRRQGTVAEQELCSLDAEAAREPEAGDGIIDRLHLSTSLDRQRTETLKADLDEALGCLPEETRAVLVARFLDGWTAGEIASQYGKTEQTINNWLRRGIAGLRKSLQGKS